MTNLTIGANALLPILHFVLVVVTFNAKCRRFPVYLMPISAILELQEKLRERFTSRDQPKASTPWSRKARRYAARACGALPEGAADLFEIAHKNKRSQSIAIAQRLRGDLRSQQEGF